MAAGGTGAAVDDARDWLSLRSGAELRGLSCKGWVKSATERVKTSRSNIGGRRVVMVGCRRWRPILVDRLTISPTLLALADEVIEQ
jgi:hypothetical protein